MVRSVAARFPLICLLLLAFAGCNWPGEGNGEWIELSGTVEAREVDVAFQVGGRIDALAVEEGMRVEQRQPLARLDVADLELALARARAEAAAAAAALAALEAGTRPQELRVAEAAVEQARSELAYADAELKRVSALVEDNLVSREQLERAQLQRQVASAALQQVREKLLLLREGPRQEEIDRARQEHQARLTTVRTAQRQLDYATLHSPTAGVVTLRLAEPGEVVAAGQPVLRLARMEQPWVRAYLNETDLARVRLGQPALVTVDGLERPLKGKLSFISPVAEFTPETVETRELRVDLVYRIKVQVENPEGILKIGMPADVRLGPAQGTRQ